MEKLTDKQWLDILSGKTRVLRDSKPAESLLALRTVIKKIKTEEKNEENQLAKLHIRLEVEASDRGVSLSKRLRLLVIFIIGLIAGALIPMQIATRGAHEPSFLDNFKISSQSDSEKITIRLTLKDEAPLKLAKDIIFTSIDSKVEVKVLSGDNLHLRIYGLKKLDQSQTSLKAMLGLGGEAEGNAEVVILKNE